MGLGNGGLSPYVRNRALKVLSGVEAQAKVSVAPIGPLTSQTKSSVASESLRGSLTVAYPTMNLLLHGYENWKIEEAQNKSSMA